MSKEALLKMRAWIEAEQETAKLPYRDPFVLTSLAYCAAKAVEEGPQAESALGLLRQVVETERQVKSYDVMSPLQTLFLIDQALARAS